MSNLDLHEITYQVSILFVIDLVITSIWRTTPNNLYIFINQFPIKHFPRDSMASMFPDKSTYHARFARFYASRYSCTGSHQHASSPNVSTSPRKPPSADDSARDWPLLHHAEKSAEAINVVNWSCSTAVHSNKWSTLRWNYAKASTTDIDLSQQGLLVKCSEWRRSSPTHF